MTNRGGLALWAAFGLTHAWLVVLAAVINPYGVVNDVGLYHWWVAQALRDGVWPVLDTPWVYPVVALVPMLVPAVLGTASVSVYIAAWCAMIIAADAVVVHLLERSGRARGAWWWLGFLLLLGPVGISRLDAVIVPMAIAALLVCAARPRLAAALLTLGAWIKIAPGALLLPVLLGARRPWREVVLPAAATCVVVLAVAVAGGAGSRALSFLDSQGERGLQIESVAATPWVIASVVSPAVTLERNDEISSFEVVGPGATTMAGILDPVLVVTVAALAALLWWARRRGVDVLLPGSLALLLVLIVTNKVGSAQFVGWLAIPVAVAMTADPERWWRRTAWVVAATAALTQAVYPFGYWALLDGNAVVAALLVVRNAVMVVLLATTVAHLVTAARSGRPRRSQRRGDLPGDELQVIGV